MRLLFPWYRLTAGNYSMIRAASMLLLFLQYTRRTPNPYLSAHSMTVCEKAHTCPVCIDAHCSLYIFMWENYSSISPFYFVVFQPALIYMYKQI